MGRVACPGLPPDAMEFTPTLHQIELFHHVAKHGGITAAARGMAYGIQQPAVSGQMTKLEAGLGYALFERKPFKLTEKGQAFYDYSRSYLDGLQPFLKGLAENPERILRIGVDEMLGPGWEKSLVTEAHARMPGVGLDIQRGPSPALEAGFGEKVYDLVVVLSDRKVAGTKSLELERVGLQLLVARASGIESPGHFWEQNGRVAERLICPAGERHEICQVFAWGLKALGVIWPVGMRIGAAAARWELVGCGQGVALDIAVPGRKLPRAIRAIPLTKFGRIPVRMAWWPAGEALIGVSFKG